MRGVWVHGSLGGFWAEGISEMVMLFLLRFKLFLLRFKLYVLVSEDRE